MLVCDSFIAPSSLISLQFKVRFVNKIQNLFQNESGAADASHTRDLCFTPFFILLETH